MRDERGGASSCKDCSSAGIIDDPVDVESDGSISWEDFIGSTTDLVPQLLGMFDELARGNCVNSSNQHHHRNRTPQQQQQHAFVPVGLQKRLSIVQKRKSRLSVVLDMAPAPEDELLRDHCHHHHHHHHHHHNHHQHQHHHQLEERISDETDRSTPTILAEEKGSPRLCTESQGSPTQFRYSGRRCKVHGQLSEQRSCRPLSGSSVTSSNSSSSSSGCGNDHRHRHRSCLIQASASGNPYLASVESLADTCASSQGSGDSGVVTVSESSGAGVGNGVANGKRTSGKIRMSEVDRATAARFFDERKPRYCDPQRKPVERVLLEIVDTEAVYVEHLRQVIQGYLIFWRDDPASLIRDLELNGLFSNIEDIFEFNRNFLSALDTCALDPIAVANTFTEHNDGFKVYTEYCTNYPRTVQILTDLMGHEDTAGAFRERQAALGHDLPLGSFLLKPVQRILKYHLLLQSLLQKYEAGQVDGVDSNSTEEAREAIDGALKAMTGIAEHINAMKRKHEHAVRVQEIQSLLYGWPGPDLTTSGELIAEGSFRMRGAKAPRHAFLFDRMLLLTKKREDGLLVYKAHVLCSNLTLMESISGDPLSFHVIPFDNSQIQYKLQARNLEQKREWTLQIKRVILENYNAVIPSHARQLVLQIGQNKYQDDSTTERGYKKSADRERRKSEIGIRQKLKKGRKSDISVSTADNSPMCPRKNQSAESIHFASRDENLNRSSEIRGSKIKDRFTNWRRKSEPGFQSYINLNPSDNEEDEAADSHSNTPTQELPSKDIETQTETKEILKPSHTKEINGEVPGKELKSQQSVEEIVGNILMNSEEFQRRLEKQQQHQRNVSSLHNSIIKHGYQRYTKTGSSPVVDSSEDEDTDNEDDKSNSPQRARYSRREQCFVRAVNAYNQRSFRSQYDSFRNIDADDGATMMLPRQSSTPVPRTTTRSSNNEKRSPPESFKKSNLVLGSKIIRTALRIRESCDDSGSEHEEESIYETPSAVKKDDVAVDDKGSLHNYDNLQHAWHDCLEPDDSHVQDCPTKTAVWLTKLCEGLPDQPQKCGSLPRSFQMMNPADLSHVSKSRFLQRDGKSMTERPFTIASDKPAEINLEDMERYASSCQGSSRIAKFPTVGSSTSSSTFFCSMDDASFTDTDSMTRETTLSTSAHVHPDHKIYRANGSTQKEQNYIPSTGSSLLSVLTRAGSRLQGLRSSQSTEALECSEEFERTKYFRSFSKKNKNKSNSLKSSNREGSSDIEEVMSRVVATGSNGMRVHLEVPYHKQGSPSLGARIAQSDYADPRVLFSESRRILSKSSSKSSQSNLEEKKQEVEEVEEEDDEEEEFENVEEALEGDSFYERSFETIESYVDAENEEAFRDSAIFSDVDDSSLKSTDTPSHSRKIPPPVPVKRKIRRSTGDKPTVALKPAHLKLRARIAKCRSPKIAPSKSQNGENAKEDDISAGQSQVGWVKKMVGQLQAQVDV